MATRTRTPRKPKPVPTADIKELIEEAATAQPEQQSEPEPEAPPTIFDAIAQLTFFLKEVSRNTGVPFNAVVTVAQLRMNYEITMRQLAQQTPPWAQALQPPPADEAEPEAS